MSGYPGERLRVVLDYHERTKHRPDRYAASLGYMDWANQPDPFRTFAGCDQTELPHPPLRPTPTYDQLYAGGPVVHPFGADLVGRLFYHSMALSAWKQAPGSSPWSLRINPSSGALHPTEAYLVTGSVPGLLEAPGVFHYAPLGHLLERRCELTRAQWEALTAGLPTPCLLIGLTSIHWRESWKYGERGFRYCNHDLGHAVGALAFAARTLGWQARLIEGLAHEDLGRLLGTDSQVGIEAENADALVLLYPGQGAEAGSVIPALSPGDWRRRIPAASFAGQPNRLSREHQEWPVIQEVALATRSRDRATPTLPACSAEAGERVPLRLADRGHPAERIIRQRRSAVSMDGATPLGKAAFFRILSRTLPAGFPFGALPWVPRVSLVLFVHRVEGLEPGLYLLIRHPAHERELRTRLGADWAWRTPADCPADLRLLLLTAGDVRRAAKAVSCHQDIAADGAFSLGMLSELEAPLAQLGPEFYPCLYWETGLIGQVLYLESEAAGLRGTGIGCYFDDLMHQILGIGDASWQSLYHFTIGAPLEDSRLRTIQPYAHLQPKEAETA